MFLVTFLVLSTGRTEQELENNVFQASSIAQKHNCNLCRLDYQQEQGLMSSLPLADCQIEIQRGLTTSSTAIFIPFTTQELYQSGKESLYPDLQLHGLQWQVQKRRTADEILIFSGIPPIYTRGIRKPQMPLVTYQSAIYSVSAFI